MSVIQESFGQLGHQPVYSFTMVNDHGVEVTAINYGCIITKMMVPDQQGNYENIVLGHDTLDEYVNDPYFLGAVVGRVAGRIKGGSFELDGTPFTLARNENKNHLHGGVRGFDKVVWDAEIVEDGVQFSYLSPDGEEGYPGNLYIQVSYRLNNDNELTIHYEAHSDKKTLLTVTNHSYFNLSGNGKRDILEHTLTIKSNQFLELDHELMPTGTFVNVENTPFDFTRERVINTGAASLHPQNKLVGEGYDHSFLLHTNHDREIVLSDPESGRTVAIETDEAAVVVYSGNSLKAEGEFRGVPSRKYLGLCLETQALPDAIHHPEFPSIILDKGQQYSSVTTYRFDGK
ncbi:galactose mutarotase [Neobacillus sp. MM2021_6]|uniref:aldose epimerase family protein n=1 Tax=Bacillaceae TaxID=186817 RepID=UPI00140B62C2|nr:MULTISPECIES: aldose epimerase family protein [Bacillaceae]MBO0958699.1 galactose mutarotase [Neobacillus sp. MM2021_6]NHC18206.1 galactose mutarotase [Bacillus sp. MM2020_4]